MANILARIESIKAVKAVSTALGKVSPDSPGLLGFAVGRTERYLGAGFFGYIKGYFRERAAFHGVPYDLIAGAIGTFGAGALEMMSNGNSNLAPHLLGLAGDPGMMSWINTKMTAFGGKRAGRHTAHFPPGVEVPKLPAGVDVEIGGTLPSGAGATLTNDEVRGYIRRRRK